MSKFAKKKNGVWHFHEGSSERSTCTMPPRLSDDHQSLFYDGKFKAVQKISYLHGYQVCESELATSNEHFWTHSSKIGKGIFKTRFFKSIFFFILGEKYLVIRKAEKVCGKNKVWFFHGKTWEGWRRGMSSHHNYSSLSILTYEIHGNSANNHIVCFSSRSIHICNLPLKFHRASYILCLTLSR